MLKRISLCVVMLGIGALLNTALAVETITITNSDGVPVMCTVIEISGQKIVSCP